MTERSKSPIEEMRKVEEAHMLPKECGTVQRRDMRIAFFSGAACMFHHLLDVCDDDDDGQSAMDAVAAELKAEADKWRSVGRGN